MKMYFLTLFSVLVCGISMAQSNCQEVVQLILSNSIEETIETDPTKGEVMVYYDLCPGETLTLEAGAEFPKNNTTYSQSVATTNFSWHIDEAENSDLQHFSHTFNNPGGHIISLYAEDINGCHTPDPVHVFVRISNSPTITPSVESSKVCPGVITNIGSDESSDLLFSTAIEAGSWESPPCEDEFSNPLYLPDGNGALYSTDIVLACFEDEQVLSSIHDIISIDVNIEHSYVGDLDIYLTAPNGAQIILFEKTGGLAWFGEATDDDDTENNPGVGYDYGWSMNPSYNGLMSDGFINNTAIFSDSTAIILKSDTYLPVDDFNALIGTPLNGTWTLTIIDNLTRDNGWIFSWGITINEDITPSSWSFDNYIVDEYFLPEPSIVTNLGTSIAIQPDTGIYNYTYEVVDNFGCVYSEEITITASSINTTEEITNEHCHGNDGEITLQISGGTPNYSVDWSSGTSGTTLSNLSEGTYFYTIKDDLDCETSGNVTIENREQLLFDTTINDDHCNQGIGDITLTPLNGNAPYLYRWDHTNSNQSTIQNLTEGTYRVNITDRIGCADELNVNIINIPGPTAYFEPSKDTVAYVNGMVQFINLSTSAPQTTLASSEWHFVDGLFSTEDQPEYDFNQMGTHLVELTVTDAGGCTDSYLGEVVSTENYFFWAPTAFTPNGDGKNDIYQPIIRNISESGFELFIYDPWGKLVYQSNNMDGGWNGIRQDNGIFANIATYSFFVRFNTRQNELQEKTGSFVLLK
jgi:gliding motility-associated-like protein